MFGSAQSDRGHRCSRAVKSEVEFPAFLAIRRSSLHAENVTFARVLHDQRTRTDDTPRCNGDAVAERRVYTDKAVMPDLAVARHDSMRSDEAVIVDLRIVPDVIAAPEHDVVTDLHSWLNHVGLEDERVLTDRHVGPDHRVGALVGDALVTEALAVEEDL